MYVYVYVRVCSGGDVAPSVCVGMRWTDCDYSSLLSCLRGV